MVEKNSEELSLNNNDNQETLKVLVDESNKKKEEMLKEIVEDARKRMEHNIVDDLEKALDEELPKETATTDIDLIDEENLEKDFTSDINLTKENKSTKTPEVKEDDIDLTYDEIKKYLRQMKKRNYTEEEIKNLSEEEIEEIKDYLKFKKRKSIYKFVNNKKVVSDEEIKELTDEQVEILTNKALVMSKFLTYNTKKNFGSGYKQKRKKKNKIQKLSRKNNRKK